MGGGAWRGKLNVRAAAELAEAAKARVAQATGAWSGKSNRGRCTVADAQRPVDCRKSTAKKVPGGQQLIYHPPTTSLPL